MKAKRQNALKQKLSQLVAKRGQGSSPRQRDTWEHAEGVNPSDAVVEGLR